MFATNGLGMLVGYFLSGWIHKRYALPEGGHEWASIYTVPIVLTVVAAGAFFLLFNERAYRRDSERIAETD